MSSREVRDPQAGRRHPAQEDPRPRPGLGARLHRRQGRQGAEREGRRAGCASGFEGGQMPLFRRVARRGFSNYPFRKEYATVKLEKLNVFADGEAVDRDSLLARRLMRRQDAPGQDPGRREAGEEAHRAGGQGQRGRPGRDRGGRRQRGQGRIRQGRDRMPANPLVEIFRVKDLRDRILFTVVHPADLPPGGQPADPRREHHGAEALHVGAGAGRGCRGSSTTSTSSPEGPSRTSPCSCWGSCPTSRCPSSCSC